MTYYNDTTVNIKTRFDLFDFTHAVNNGNRRLNARLQNDIDMNPGIDVKTSKTKSSDIIMLLPSILAPYEGVFDGNGHTISGIYGNCFCNMNLGTIRNLTLDGLVLQNHAAFVEYNYGRIKNCVNKATVSPQTGSAAGIVYYNYPKAKITGCRNEGILNIDSLPYPPFTEPSQICCHRVNKYKYTPCELRRMYTTTKKTTNKGAGKLELAGNNSLLGLYLKSLKTDDVFGHTLNECDTSDITKLLEQGAYNDADNSINKDGQNYLHLLLQCDIPVDLVDWLCDAITLMATKYDCIDFEQKDRAGKRPEDLLKTPSGKVRRGFAKVVQLIRSIAEQNRPEIETEMSTIGF